MKIDKKIDHTELKSKVLMISVDCCQQNLNLCGFPQKIEQSVDLQMFLYEWLAHVMGQERYLS